MNAIKKVFEAIELMASMVCRFASAGDKLGQMAELEADKMLKEQSKPARKRS